MEPVELAKAGTFNLLQALILSNNVEASDIEQTEQRLETALQTINDQALQIEQLQDELQLQTELVAKQEKELNYNQKILLKAEELAHVCMAKDKELVIAKTKVSELQQQLSGLGNAQKLNKLVKTQKAKAVERNKRIATLERQAKEYRKELKEEKSKLDISIDKIRELRQQLAHNTGAGLYHNGEHHLIIWPEKNKMQRVDGSIFEGRSLLYMHQSGCGKMITYDPQSNEASFCQTPRGGLRPSTAVKEFAKNWLYTVNEVQDGVVHDSDMIAVNYNVEIQEQSAA